MHVRRDRKKSRKGKTYVSIAHNVWEPDESKGGRARPVVFARLGPEERVDPEVAAAMAAALESYIEARWKIEVARNPQANRRDVVEQAAREFSPHVGTMRIWTSREYGMRVLLEEVWRDLGLGEMLEGFAQSQRIQFPFERMVFGMVLNRLVDPKSKKACNEWLEQEAYFPEWDGGDVQHLYRALDVLHEHWEELERRLYGVLHERLPERDRKKGLLLVDTTSQYFAAKRNDEEVAEIAKEWEAYRQGEGNRPVYAEPQVVNEPPLRLQGHNKDGHPGQPQVVMANLVTPSGLVLGHRIYPGNTNDQTVAKDLIAQLQAPSAEIRIWVSDNGLVNQQLLRQLDEAGWHRLSAESARKSELAEQHILPQRGRYTRHSTKEHLSYQAFDVEGRVLGQDRNELWILTRNEKERTRQLKKIERHLDQVKEILATQTPGKPHGKKVCAAATHQSLKRYLRPNGLEDGGYVLNLERIRLEKQLAGVRLYRTTMTSWTPEEALEAYWALQQVERNHRDYKGPLQLRPAYHRADRRIRAHVMLVVLACNCLRQMEIRTGYDFRQIDKLMSGLKVQKVQQGLDAYWQRTELTSAQEELLRAMKLPAPPKTWSLDRHKTGGRS